MTVNHYKRIHLKNGVQCKKCEHLFANIDHMKEHFMLIHNDSSKNSEDEKKVKTEDFYFQFLLILMI